MVVKPARDGRDPREEAETLVRDDQDANKGWLGVPVRDYEDAMKGNEKDAVNIERLEKNS